ncbi:MAG TPA: NAD(P)/FAD-dependent oxidoreductase, partial [Terriglobia bacterium]|nr:NAD(P)/FAD-dependent oxidoreductase [Terriglobia bacterium]
MGSHDAIVVGSGPNGLAAAIRLAQAGLSVLVLEAQQCIGGGAQTMELTLPGFSHDVCSAVHPLAASSPFFKSLPLQAHGLQWIQPPLALAHPLDDGTAAVLSRSIEETCEPLGSDAAAYRRLMSPLAAKWSDLIQDVLGPPQVPKHPLALARFGWNAWRDAKSLAGRFRGPRARALFAGIAAHSMLPLERGPSAAFALLLGAAGHAVGWPIARGGSQTIANALARHLRSLGGEIRTGEKVNSLDELTAAKVILCDVSPRQLLALAGPRIRPSYRRILERFDYGPGVYKVDWALAGSIPWTAKACHAAGTVHVGGTFEEIERSEGANWRAQIDPHPFVILSQPSLFDPSRAPDSKHVAWAYCHVPNGSTMERVEAIENQIERFAPGFRRLILARHTMDPAALERHNPNLVGGSINGGAQTYRQAILRPSYKLYGTSARGIYVCSASTPPGGGVHGMCGYYAAQKALRNLS